MLVRLGLAIAALGIAAFATACAVDGSRNVHDVNELGAAAHQHYSVTLDYAQGAALLSSDNITTTTLEGWPAAAYGCADLVVGRQVAVVCLDRLSETSFALALNGHEIPHQP